jgi:hypothetical protein
LTECHIFSVLAPRPPSHHFLCSSCIALPGPFAP